MARVFIDEVLRHQVPAAERAGEIWLTLGRYRARLADNDWDRAAVYRTGQAVGTYRLQSGAVAARNIGYYSAQLFEFSPYERLRESVLELGRAAVHRDHHSLEVLTLLWRGIAQYAAHRNLRYLIGCSSLTSQDPREGSAMYQRLQTFLVEPPLRTCPTAEYALSLTAGSAPPPKLPKLLRAYLSLGAKICGPPALDREFRTIDFLTLLDLQSLLPVVRARFLR
jgi:putative hemolysin